MSVSAIVQSLFVLSVPALLALTPGEGAVRAVAPGAVPLAAIVNAAAAVDGRLLASAPDGSLILAGRRDRLLLALLPLGVLAVPVRDAGCGEG